MTIFLVSIFGLSFGSFISMLSYRLPLQQDIICKRSHCPSCKHILTMLDLVPLFTWLLNNGKCRYCKSEIHFRYPLIEISTSFFFALTISILGLTNHSYIILTLVICLIALSVIDFEHYIIPDSLQIIMLILALLWSYLCNYPINHIILSGLSGFLSSYGLAASYRFFRHKDGLGFGDVKFITIAAIFIGYQNLVFFYLLSGLFGLATGLIWQYFFAKKLFPFGPSLAASLFLCLIIPFLFDMYFDVSINILNMISFSIIQN
ncbi:MAG: prepilin peptidase [Rickettsiales bacterium]